jgi:hypothetical protein
LSVAFICSSLSRLEGNMIAACSQLKLLVRRTHKIDPINREKE